jgi:3-deoxy-D-manno-octulosonic-acid transferase
MKGFTLLKHTAYVFYTVLSGCLFFLLLPIAAVYSGITGRYRKGVLERFGIFRSRAGLCSEGKPRIWIHAASLGEVNVALTLIKAVRSIIPQSSFVLSTMTPHGRESAQGKAGPDTRVIYAPVDFIGCVRPALNAVDPDVLVFVETEIWPAWLFEAKRRGIPTALVNGRISPRSLVSYMRLRLFFKTVLARLDRLSMIGEPDAERIIAIGADPEKVEINGNAKYDALAGMAEPDLEIGTRYALGLAPGTRVIVAGSTRGGEEEQILDAYREILSSFPDTVLVIAPRHIQRSGQILSMAASCGFSCRLRTEITVGRPRTEQVMILDTFGELFAVYSTASVVFCGASFVPLGGQNPLEPASWGKTVLYGPFMDDFADARALLEESGAGLTVSGSRDLAREVVRLFGRPEELLHRGELGRKALLSHRHASARHAKVITGLLHDGVLPAASISRDIC